MIKKQIYPKTKRVSLTQHIAITEKLDGSNLCFAKYNNKLYICQRRTIFTLDEIDSPEVKSGLYKGLYGWLKEHGAYLLSALNEGSAICGEWIGMGRLHYNFDDKFFMFAKANISEDLELYNIKYDHELFVYPFTAQEIPNYIRTVPVITDNGERDINYLNELYQAYTKQVDRNVEGFIVNLGHKST